MTAAFSAALSTTIGGQSLQLAVKFGFNFDKQIVPHVTPVLSCPGHSSCNKLILSAVSRSIPNLKEKIVKLLHPRQLLKGAFHLGENAKDAAAAKAKQAKDAAATKAKQAKDAAAAKAKQAKDAAAAKAKKAKDAAAQKAKSFVRGLGRRLLTTPESVLLHIRSSTFDCVVHVCAY